VELLDAVEAWLEWARAALPPRVFSYLDVTLRMFAITALFLVLERFGPVERKQPRSRLFFNLRWMLVFSTLTALIMGLGFGRILPLVRGALGGPWLSLGRPDTIVGYIGNWLVFFLVFDFFYYWFHRMQHATSLLWRQHLLHHTERSLNVSTAQRHHWLEEPLRLLAIGIPSGTLVAVDTSGAPYVAFVLSFWGFFIHSNLRLGLGPLSGWLTGPQVHRIHHSIDPQHQNHNFAAFFPFWDRLFGTYWSPARDEFPQVGIAGVACTGRLWEACWLPFRPPVVVSGDSAAAD
jgi:sterol desaturase/sphingolipid hydroxylase (fatty acid hydroxylase superfamily)